MKKATALHIIIALFFFSFTSCGPSYVMDPPDEFAHFHKDKRFLKYISSDGVRVKVSSLKNEPSGDVTMWQNAIQKYLSIKGYHLAEKKEIATSENLKGVYTEYLYSYNAEPYVYGIALFVKDEYIFLIEAGGPKQKYLAHRDRMLKAVNTFKVK